MTQPPKGKETQGWEEVKTHKHNWKALRNPPAVCQQLGSRSDWNKIERSSERGRGKHDWLWRQKERAASKLRQQLEASIPPAVCRFHTSPASPWRVWGKPREAYIAETQSFAWLSSGSLNWGLQLALADWVFALGCAAYLCLEVMLPFPVPSGLSDGGDFKTLIYEV